MVEKTITIDGEDVVVTLEDGEAEVTVYDKKEEIRDGVTDVFGEHRFKGVYPSTGAPNEEHTHFAVVGTSLKVADSSRLSDIANGVLYITSGSKMAAYDHSDEASAGDIVFFF